MLDAIHGRFASSRGAWPRPVSRESPAIVFRLLLLENFNLSDDLYVKMNARGKALTGRSSSAKNSATSDFRTNL